MRTKHQLWAGILSAVGFFLLIIDTKTALNSAREGLHLCISAVIPSLFPFFILSSVINSLLIGKKFSGLQPLRKLINIPKGAESLLLLGFLGGYPIGAQCITDAYENGKLNRNDAWRMLGFCSNSGPAFIFGMVGCLFDQPSIPWILWILHMVCALIVGCLLPRNRNHRCTITEGPPLPIAMALKESLKVMSVVCGWVMLFRIVIGFCEHWFFWMLPSQIQVGLAGLLELSNGCFALQSISSPGQRFILSAGILGFGGICVAMQTVSLTGDLGTGMYFPGKLLHGLISTVMAAVIQTLIFSEGSRYNFPPTSFVLCLLLIAGIVILVRHKKKTVEIPIEIVYNTEEAA